MVVVAAKTSCSARLGIKYDFRDLSIFDGGAVVIAGGAEEEEDSLAGRGALVDHLLQPLGAVVGIRALHETRSLRGTHVNSHPPPTASRLGLSIS